ncbi:MAG: DUF4276 family protein [Prosthecobacter sp.]|uniref:DUF4276 family protein n=1 Tax=Prosthecobacter sp. TaxID=1965333 RepID=UPI0039038F6F
MSRVSVYCLVEGFSEANLVKRLLAPHLSRHGVDIFAPMVTTRRDRKAGKVHKGGGASFQPYRNDLERLIKQWRGKPEVWITTLMDVYALPSDFPGRADGYTLRDHHAKAAFFEGKIHEVANELGAPRFIPHLALHEFETLLLADVAALGTLFLDKGHEIQQLAQDIAAFPDVEAINHTPQGSPSNRIARRIPGYDRYKANDQSGAINVLEVVGLDALRQRCQHFDAWITRLELLAPAETIMT